MSIQLKNELDPELKYRYFENQEKFFSSIIKDMKNAKKYIYLETYRYGDGAIGKNVRDVLIEKAKEGVEVKVLIDSWGSMVDKDFFAELIKYKGEVRFFRIFKVTFNFIKYNNRRDHRKLLVIDDNIMYTGSSNIAERVLLWREFNVRIEGAIAGIMKEVFLNSYEVHNNYFHKHRKHIFALSYKSFDIVRDIPSIKYRKIRKKLKNLVKIAKKKIIIETPYFVPDYRFIYALTNAVKRGVNVTLIIPKKSDVKVVDVMVSSYLGHLHRKGVHIKYYTKKFMHSKVALFDNTYFSFGSANMDHRSFSYQYELNLFGKDKKMRDIVQKHIQETLKGTEDFDYEKWKHRPLFQKFLEILYIPARTFM
jgi:cardiolipin synthase